MPIAFTLMRARSGRAGRACDGRERAVVLGGDGCPEILEFAVAEFAVMLGDLAAGRRELPGSGVGVAAPVPVHLGAGPGRRGDAWKACRIVAELREAVRGGRRLRRPADRGTRRLDHPVPVGQDRQGGKMHADPDSGAGRGSRAGPRTRCVRRPLQRARHQNHVHQGRRRRGHPQQGDPRRDRRGAENLRRHPPGPAPPRRRGRHHRRPPLHPRTPHPSPPPPPHTTPADTAPDTDGPGHHRPRTARPGPGHRGAGPAAPDTAARRTPRGRRARAVRVASHRAARPLASSRRGAGRPEAGDDDRPHATTDLARARADHQVDSGHGIAPARASRDARRGLGIPVG